ncbi:hypothetical protein LV89_04326 [Arcicella aurantiaca]|uniref:Uncharacterized protein n=1 Tax=Arcicella aurantiaca TaxID=591202 RepID=A0A316E3Z0_9BACT|nr:hypothetical protein [Arcicella aurantiaca]PWK17610.1 hypothetical protein LV89_04326 [Arcicella aurantiaca]
MTFPPSFQVFIWVMMGALGVSCSVIFSFISWNWLQSGQTKTGSEPRSNFTFLGYAFLFASGLMCCGIAGPPGYALSDDPNLVNKVWILRASGLSLVLSLIAWICILIGQRISMKRNNQNAQRIEQLEKSIQELQNV